MKIKFIYKIFATCNCLIFFHKVSSDGVYMFCGCGNKVNVLEISTGKIHCTIGQEEDEEISCFALSPDNQVGGFS